MYRRKPNIWVVTDRYFNYVCDSLKALEDESAIAEKTLNAFMKYSTHNVEAHEVNIPYFEREYKLLSNLNLFGFYDLSDEAAEQIDFSKLFDATSLIKTTEAYRQDWEEQQEAKRKAAITPLNDDDQCIITEGGKTYHKLSCLRLRRLKGSQSVVTVAEAKAQGKRSCAECHS